MSLRKILFAGLGNMGLPMARNLNAKGRFSVHCFDTSADRLKLASQLVDSLGNAKPG